MISRPLARAAALVHLEYTPPDIDPTIETLARVCFGTVYNLGYPGTKPGHIGHTRVHTRV